jgi:hypothetical protein
MKQLLKIIAFPFVLLITFLLASINTLIGWLTDKKYNPEEKPNSISKVISHAAEELKKNGSFVRPRYWQATDVSLGMFEILNYSFKVPIPHSEALLKFECQESEPWADMHFLERVSGEPLNPPPSYKKWPFYKDDEKWRRAEGQKFSHSYPERIWPPYTEGIRYRYGNLDDVINLLAADPLTRQAFLPIWFPEDTGAHHGERVPCTIGYFFICRDERLHMYYTIRSCDYRRHFRNDIYLTCKLLLWVLQELREKDDYWEDIEPGNLVMNVWNLHVFEGEENFI